MPIAERPTSFGALLRHLRQGASLTQEKLGRRAGLSAKAIGALERGERHAPHPGTVRALVTALALAGDDRAALLDSVSWRRRSLDDAAPGAPDGTPAGSVPGRAGSARMEHAGANRRQVDQSQRAAAYELFIELVTRIAVVEQPPLDVRLAAEPDQGLLRDALTSLHSLFDTTRGILRRHGPGVLEECGDGAVNVGAMALTVINDVVRPVLAEWHPALLDHESRRPSGVSPAEHERAWDRGEELREVLLHLRVRLRGDARRFAAIAGVRDTRAVHD